MKFPGAQVNLTIKMEKVAAGKVTTLVTRKIKARKVNHAENGSKVKMGRRPRLCAEVAVIMEVYCVGVII